MSDTDDEAKAKTAAQLRDVHALAIRRFDIAVRPQMEIRRDALMARRFVSVPGAMWEGQFGEMFGDVPKPEINKVMRGVRKIEGDYRQNRIVPDFRPDGPNADQDTADTLDGLYRADFYKYKCQQAVDNAVSEMIKGGFGAYRIANVLEDEDDPDNDSQRINPAMMITDADQSVFFDPNSRYYDKHDARYAFIVTSHARDAFEEDYGHCATDWPDSKYEATYDWFTPDVVRVAEYYEVEKADDTLLISTLLISGAEDRVWLSQCDDDYEAKMKGMGWQVRRQKRKRTRVRKYTMSGAEVISDDGYISGTRIPIVPFYFHREFIDNVERFKGHVHDKMDASRIYNAKIGKLLETDATSPRQRPIFLAQQMPPHLRDLWALGDVERHGYALVDPVIDPITGQIVSQGPVGMITPVDVPPVTALLLQAANQDIIEDDQDSSETVKANVSEEAMNLAATRVDAKSGMVLDNIRMSQQSAGEIYESMTADCYWEEGRKIPTMDDEGGECEAVLREPYTDKSGKFGTRNDFTRGSYKTVVSVSEATATRRDKAVRAALNTAELAAKIGATSIAQAAAITAIMNQDGEGLDDLKKFARKEALNIGLVEPNDEEKAAAEQAAQNVAPDPTAAMVEAQAMALQASAAKDMATVQKIGAEIEKIGADTQLSDAKARATVAGVIVEARKVDAPALK